jgi:hypothetical protein
VPTIDVGDPLPDLAVRVENPPGTLVDVGTMVLTVTDPTGTPSVVPNTNTAVGLYRATSPVVTTEGGTWVARWVATGANACVKERLYAVGDPVDIDEVREALKIAQTTATDGVLYGRVAAATSMVERLSGRALRRRTVTDKRSGGKYAVALTQVPVDAIVSVTEDGVTLTSDSWTLRESTGLLYRNTPQSGAVWAVGAGNVVVRYTVAAGPVPDHLRDAIIEATRMLIAGYRGSSGQPKAGSVEDVERRIEQLIGARIPRF